MNLTINTRDVDNVKVLDLRGDLVFGPTTNALAQHIRQLVADNQRRVLVNLNDVTFIDSCGVGELISGFTSVKKSGGVLRVCGAGEGVDKVLRIVRLPLLIEVFETEAEALANFGDAD